MPIKYQSITGTKDILPKDIFLWRYVEGEARKLFFLYGYKELRTPIIEQTELFVRSVGVNTDIVEKEMYTFVDKDGQSASLRPEETAGVVRAYLENSLYAKQSLWKFYYIGPMFRRERPQAGRFRQFHQIGAEVIGSYLPSADAEIILWLMSFFKKLNIPNVALRLNSSGCPKCRPGYTMRLKEELEAKISCMCIDCQRRYQRNIFRVLDCKQPNCVQIIKALPSVMEFLCADCKEHFNALSAYLRNEGVEFQHTPQLVRGLDYYTKTVFECVHEGLGSQNAVAGGGRYDLLVQEMGGQAAGAVGFSIGVERLLSLIKNPSEEEEKLDVFLVSCDKESYALNFSLLQKLRSAGISSDMDYEGKSIKAQMRAADRTGARYVLIRGGDEIREGKITLKDMGKGFEEKVVQEKIIEKIKGVL